MTLQVAVLGSGIMGSSTALALAARGLAVTLFDASEHPFQRASRWNEGKIHLGYLYAANPGLETARHLLPGGLHFKPLVERTVGCSLDPAVTPSDDLYLVHRASVTSAPAMRRYVAAVDRLVAEHPDAGRYLVDLRAHRSAEVGLAELSRHYDTKDIVAGFRVPERSVSTTWLAQRFVEALEAEPKIELVMQTRIARVLGSDGPLDGPFFLETNRGRIGPFDVVVNALWEGRPAVDSALGFLPPAPWSHRFRLSLFLRSREDLAIGSAVIATGPFGDIKQYTKRDFYLSWYPAGLQAAGTEISPPPVPELDRQDEAAIVDRMLSELGGIIPAVRTLRDKIETAELNGGWVYACGQGPLTDPASTLHRRDHPNIYRRGSYISIDTGKYSIAPWLAERIADTLRN